MPITKKDVEYIAQLAMLTFSDEEKEKFTIQLNHVLEYMEKLNTLDTSRIEPLSHVIELDNVFRPDELLSGVSTEDALKNAPSKTERFFKVPKVIEDKS